MTTRRCTLDGRQRSKAAVLAKLGRDLGWDRPLTNLDALYDVLRREIRGPVEIVWKLTPRAHVSLGADLAPIAATLREVAAERPDLRLEIVP
ncbi:MAG: barstar family protein [Geminicoccaceae bacterium]